MTCVARMERSAIRVGISAVFPYYAFGFIRATACTTLDHVARMERMRNTGLAPYELQPLRDEITGEVG